MEYIQNKNLQQLIELLKSREVLCFGTGNQGKRAALLFENWNVRNHLLGYIDNDPQKQGSDINIDGNSYHVYSLSDAMKKFDGKPILVLVTCLAYKSIFQQLQETCADCAWEYMAIDEVADSELQISHYDAIIRESEKPLIPKKIHYAWLGGEMPGNLKENIAHWKTLCPDYEFYEWNENNYDVTKNPYMKQTFKKKMWGFVPDYMRLDVIYEHGGIYLDTDIEMIKKPDALLYQNCFGCVDASLVMNLGSGFGAVPHHPMIRKLRDYYDDVSFVRNDGSIDDTSCNTHSHRVLKKYGVRIDDTLQNVGGMNIYPMIIQGASQYTRTHRVTEQTFWVHYGNMSWFQKAYL